MVAEQRLVGVHHVGVRRDGVEVGAPAVLGADAGDAAVGRLDALDAAADLDRAAEVLEQSDHALDQGAGAAAREPHAPLLLERVDQRIDAAGLERVAADEQRVEAKRLPQLLVVDVARDDRIDRAEGLVLHEAGRRLEHRLEVEERLVAELEIALAEDTLAIFQKLAVALDIARRLLGDLREQRLVVVRIVEHRAILPQQAVERRDRH